MRRILLVGVLALLLAALMPRPSGEPAAADTVDVDDTADDRFPQDIRTLRVDNSGRMVGATALHVAAAWTGSVELRFDVRGGRAAEYTAVIFRGRAGRNSLRTADGTRWRCAALVAESGIDNRQTRLSAPRHCFGGAETLTVRARVDADGDRDSVSSPLVTRESRPNVVMIMVDDMRDDDLAYMPRTQALIGDQGVRFANSLAPYPLCCPARASVLTGQYAHNHRVWSHLAPWGFTSFDDDSTLATWLQDAGYATVYIGKYLNGYGERPEPGRATGTSTAYVPPGWTDWRASIDGGLPWRHPDHGTTYRYANTTLNDNGVEYDNYAGQYQTNVYGDLAERVVTTRAASDQPFFFYLSFTAPHGGGPNDPDDPGVVTSDDGTKQNFPTPYVPPEVRGSLDDLITSAPGANWYREVAPLDKPEYLRDIAPLNDAETTALLEVTRQRAESLTVVDQQVARTIRALERSGELDDTLVMFTSDNGFFLGEQGIRAGKTLPHEPAIHTPLLMRGPGIPAGEIRYDPFLSIDFAPTIADLAGVRPGLPVDGQSMLSVARSGDLGWTRAVLTETGQESVVRDTDEAGNPLSPEDPGAADIRYAIGVRSDRYLYIHLANDDEELYDMAVDPDQYDNLINVESYQPIRDLMREQLATIRACDGPQCRAQLPQELASAPGESVRDVA